MSRMFWCVQWFLFCYFWMSASMPATLLLSLSEQTWCQISLSLTLSLFSSLALPQSQGSPYSMSGQRNVRALWANCKGEGRQNQVCVSQPVWYIQRKEPWNTKACWWVSQRCHCHNIPSVLSFYPGHLPLNSASCFCVSAKGVRVVL